MSPALLVSGAWQLRHGEPVPPGGAMVALSPVALARPGDPFALVPVGIDGAGRPGAVPLAVLAGGEAAPVSHLVHALDAGAALLARVDEPSGPARPLEDRIADLFAAWHLRLNNNECFYTVGPPWERSFDLPPDASPSALAEALHAAADDGDWTGFAPRFRVPPRSWNVEVSILRVATRGGPLLLASSYGRRRGSWDEGVVTVDVLGADGDPSRQTRREVRTRGAPLERALAAVAGGPLRRVGRRIRLADEVPVESLNGGHLFAVSVECFLDPDDPDWSAVAARVAYDRTRGTSAAGAAEEGDALCGHVVATLARCGAAAVPGPDRLLRGLAPGCAAPPGDAAP